MRRRLLEEAQVVAAGGEPKAVVRDADKNVCIALPIVRRDAFVNGFSLAELASLTEAQAAPFLPREFVFQSGQPEAIRQAYRRAMGLEVES